MHTLALHNHVFCHHGLIARYMKVKKLITAISLLCLATACAPMSAYESVNSPELIRAAESAQSYRDHHALTTRFENLARDMHTKTKEQKQLLEHYQDKSYLYGRQAQDRQAHTWALIRKYEQAERTSLAKAASHRQIAAELERRNYSSSEHDIRAASARFTQATGRSE